MSINRRLFLKVVAATGTLGFSQLTLASQKSASLNSSDFQLVSSSPMLDGFRMPAEFEPQEAIWLVWPETTEWRLDGQPAEQAYIELATAISHDIPVRLAVSSLQAARVKALLPSAVEIIEMNRHRGTGWVRDDGPTFLINNKGERRGVDWVFNDWGDIETERFSNDFIYEQSETADQILKHEKTPYYKAPLVLEGGSIHSDGFGTIITTEECLLNPNRNPELYKDEIEGYLKEYLGAKKVIWIPRGVYKDDTSGHVDNMCCFAAPGEVFLTWTDDKEDEQYQRSREALTLLESSTDARGLPIKVHKLYQPGPLYMTAEERAGFSDRSDEVPTKAESRLPASYINYIRTNKRIIFPLLDPKTDKQAFASFAQVFPKHEIVGIKGGREILLHGGNLHCISQNIPARNLG